MPGRMFFCRPGEKLRIFPEEVADTRDSNGDGDLDGTTRGLSGGGLVRKKMGPQVSAY